MFFQDRFEFGRYGAEFQTSYMIVKLADKNQTLKFAKEMATASKGLATDGTDVDVALEKSTNIFNLMYGQIKDSFISGEIYDSETKAVRPMKKDDIDSFPTKVIRDISGFLQGTLEKKD